MVKWIKALKNPRRDFGAMPLRETQHLFEKGIGVFHRRVKAHESENRRYYALMSSRQVVIHVDPDPLGGTAVFAGTRVPFQTLVDYLIGGHPLGGFLDDFPTVSHDMAVEALEQAKDAILGLL